MSQDLRAMDKALHVLRSSLICRENSLICTANLLFQQRIVEFATSVPRKGYSSPVIICPEDFDGAISPQTFIHTSRTYDKEWNSLFLVVLVGIEAIIESSEETVSRILIRSRCPILVLADSINNIDALSSWLNIRKENTVIINDGLPKVHIFSYSPKPHEIFFDDFLAEKVMHPIELLMERESVVVYCCSISSCKKTASKVSSRMRDGDSLSISDIKDSDLRLCLQNRVGYLHDKMDKADFMQVRNMFQSKRISILCTTLPDFTAHLVIIKGLCANSAHPRLYTHREITKLSQMGEICVVMTDKCNEQMVKEIFNRHIAIESSLTRRMKEAINTEVAHRQICARSSVLMWLRQSYIFQKDKAIPKYGREALDELIALNMISNDIKPTFKGNLCAEYDVTIATMDKLMESGSNLSDILDTISQAKEFEHRIVRLDEMVKLEIIRNDPQLRFRVDISGWTPSIKVRLLIDASLTYGQLDDWYLAMEFLDIKPSLIQITECLSEVMKELRNYEGLKNTLILRKCIDKQMWENNTSRISEQIEELKAFSRKIFDNHIETLVDMRRMTAAEWEILTNHRCGWGQHIVQHIQEIGMYSVFYSKGKIVVRNNSTKEQKIHVLVGSPHENKLFKYVQTNIISHLQFPVDTDVVVTVIDDQFIGSDVTVREPKSPAWSGHPTQRNRIVAFLEDSDNEDTCSIGYYQKTDY